MNHKVHRIKLGEKANITNKFSEDDVKLFAKISTDTNPLHLDAKFAANTTFKTLIVHGILVGSLFSSIIGTILPGKGSIYLSQTYSFKKPIFINEAVKAEVEVTNIREDKPIITLKTICYNSKDEIAIEGEAVVMI